MAPGAFEVRFVIVCLDIDGLTRQKLARAQDCAGQAQPKDQYSTLHGSLASSDTLRVVIVMVSGASRKFG